MRFPIYIYSISVFKKKTIILNTLMDRNIFCIHAQLFKTVKCGSIFLKLNVFIYAALCKKDQMSSAYKRTKSHLNTAPRSSTYLDTLPRKPVLFGKKRKKNAF